VVSTTPSRSRFRRLATIGETLAPESVRKRAATTRRLLAVADCISALAALYVCVVVLGSEDHLTTATLAAAPIVVIVSKIVGLYDRDELVLHKSTLDEAPALFQVSTLYALTLWLVGDAAVEGQLGSKQILALWAGLFVSLVIGRMGARAWVSSRFGPERCMLIGDSTACEYVRAKLASSPRVNATIAVHLPMPEPVRAGRRPRAFSRGGDVSPVGDLATLVHEQQLHRVIVAPGPQDSDELHELIRTAKNVGMPVSILPRVFEVVGSSVEFDSLQGAPVLGVRRFGLNRSSRMTKRALDLAGAVLGVIAILPLLAFIAIAVKLDSRGPVLFRQLRVGRDGRIFGMLKFRTMVEGADGRKAELRTLNEAGDGLFKITDDPRVTRTGRFLRRTSLDELPQLFNVLRGEMSLVGPRPLVLDEDEQIEGWHRRRLHLTPGMTGHWQVLGGSARIPLQEMVKIDYLYVSNWSLWEDIKILLRTVPLVVGRKGV
jgi:exopolysaccharide biosynthesis polyprenyl glycosylphosphotransferase